jgi:hypothetical protein
MVRKTEIKDKNPISPESASQRILLEEYRSIHSEYLNRRDEGVTRLIFFITAASVLLGGTLVFASGASNLPLVYFKIILLSAIFILTVIGLEICNFLVYRDIASDRDIRGLARIRNYFTKLDPELEEYFVTSTSDTPTGYISRNSSGMRRVAQVIVGFLFGLASAILSTFVFLPLGVNIAIGVGITILVVLILELNARRKFKRALENAEKNIKFKKNVDTKQEKS